MKAIAALVFLTASFGCRTRAPEPLPVTDSPETRKVIIELMIFIAPDK